MYIYTQAKVSHLSLVWRSLSEILKPFNDARSGRACILSGFLFSCVKYVYCQWIQSLNYVEFITRVYKFSCILSIDIIFLPSRSRSDCRTTILTTKSAVNDMENYENYINMRVSHCNNDRFDRQSVSQPLILHVQSGFSSDTLLDIRIKFGVCWLTGCQNG